MIRGMVSAVMSPAGSKRIPSLDGLRAVSIAFVTLAHMAQLGHAPSIFGGYGRFGVQVFFVISGYIITTLLLKEREASATIGLRAFYLRRFWRIIPAAYCFLIPAILLHLPEARRADIISALTFTSNYNVHPPRWMGHIWSLSVEEQFYLLWPPILAAFFSRRTKILVWALCASPAFTLGFYALHWNAYVGAAFPTTYDSLAMGCLAAVLGSKLDFTRSRWFVLCAPAALLLESIPWTGKVSGVIHVVLLWPLTHVAVTLFLLHAVKRKYWLLNVQPVVWIGVISYGLYLWQPVLLADQFRFAPLWMLLCAALSYYLVEQPLLRWRRSQAPTAPPLTLPNRTLQN